VVIVGEEHDDAVGHALQRTLVEDAMTRDRRAALSLEMLERDEQNVLDDYLDGIIDAAALIKLTHSSAREGGDNGWERWYLPIIDAAKERGARVVAANAPRRYVRLAGRSGYQALRRLPEARRRLVALPLTAADDYRQRFRDVLMEMQESDDEPESEGSVHSAGLSEEQFVSMFRSQQVWDATMARSIAEARRAGASKVIHMVGQFHSDFDGGLVKEVRRRLPARSRVLVISMQRAWPDAIREQDRDRADIIIYTGDRIEESADDHGDTGGAGDSNTAEEREDTDPDFEDADSDAGAEGSRDAR
jgi:uncharacterized iron-regulated protein